jgi:hypothetical protein
MPDYLDHMPQDGREYDVQCARCGSSAGFEGCEHCGGHGFSGHDCGEDSCCCLYPHDNVVCEICDGEGGWSICLSSEAYCEANPLPGREHVKRGAVEYFALPERTDAR